MKTKWQCPYHKGKQLRTIPDYPGALVHSGCREIFTVIDNRLCQSTGAGWLDVENGNQTMLKRMSSNLYEATVTDKDGKLISSTILMEEGDDKMLQRRKEQ